MATGIVRARSCRRATAPGAARGFALRRRRAWLLALSAKSLGKAPGVEAIVGLRLIGREDSPALGPVRSAVSLPGSRRAFVSEDRAQFRR
jgi:hypothetical protein